MNRKRLSREDSRELTTQRLLDAAQKLIAKKGLEGLSVEAIAEAAGYSRGAFYSNFKDKDELFIELLRREHRQNAAQLNALIDDSLPFEVIRARTGEQYSRMYRDNESCMNLFEARMLAARDARFRAKFNALMTQKRQQIADFIRYFYLRADAKPPIVPEELAMAFMSLAEGVKLYMMSNPSELTGATAESLLKVFVDALMDQAGRQPKSQEP